MSDTHVAILIPSAGQRALANLARDAIAKFTDDVSHEVWLRDEHPQCAEGSLRNGLALRALIEAATFSVDVTHVFCMHDDALPLRPGWLSYLLSKPGPVTGVKASQRNGYAHVSGVLFTRGFALTHSMGMLPDLPARDAGEFPPDWVASAQAHKPSEGLYAKVRYGFTYWWEPFDCEVSFHEDGDPFYIHLGGGTIGAGTTHPDSRAHQERISAWCAAARKGLGL